MTLFFEISRPFQPRPGVFSSRIHGGRCVRVWWLWFSCGIVPVGMSDFVGDIRSGKIIWVQ